MLKRHLATLEEYLAKVETPNFDPINLFDPNFKPQIDFILDPAKKKTLFCTRRAAKSYTAGLYMVYTALSKPNANCMFLGLTRDSALDIIWKDIMKVINQKHYLGGKFNYSTLTLTFPNGSVIRLRGVDKDEEEMNKLLGKKFDLVCIDEGSLYTIDTKKLVYGILGPAMADSRGTICIMGTSSNFTRGLFYDITTGVEAGWKLFTWSAHDNPHIRTQWAEELEDIRVNRPLFMNTPLFKQWYLNEWVVDTDKLVYKFDEKLNIYDELPNVKRSGWTYVLGVDTGWEDDNAFVLCAFHENDPNLYVVKTFAKAHMTFDQVTEKIEEFMRDEKLSPAKIIIDGANKQGVESMRARSAIPFEYADKIGKVDFIEICNGDLVQGKIKIHRSERALIQEMMGLVWKTEGDKIVVPKKEHPALPNHRCDAFLYAWRNGYHYHSEALKTKLVVGSAAWYQEQSKEIWGREREAIDREQTKGEWPTEGDFRDLKI